jgi:predicted metal-dependent hydrolase
LQVLVAPLSIIDYIVVRELWHLRHRDHSDALWTGVDNVLQDYQRHKEWLHALGHDLDL